MGVSNELSCEAGSFSRCHNPHRFLLPEILRLYFLAPEPWVVRSVLLPSCSCQLSACKLGPPGQPLLCSFWSASCHLATCPLLPGFLSRPLLPVWMNVSSFASWLSDFHTVQLYGSSGLLLYLIFLLSFFWLCKEAKCIYLCLYLGWKSGNSFSLKENKVIFL